MAKKKSRYNVKNGNAYDQLLFETIMSQIIDAPIKSLERSTAYKVNDICSEATLPKGGFLICSTAGTTNNTVPTAFGTATEGATITDGTAKFTVRFLDQLVSSVNNNKPDSKGNIVLPNFIGSSSNNNGSNGLVPAPAKGEQNLPLLASAKFGILPVVGGGTGANNAAAARTNLGIDTLTGFNPVGSIIAFAGNTLPNGYLLCDGSNISRTTYKNLFNVIGTTYGTGDGSTTFTLPNLIDRFIEGSSVAGKYVAAGLPNLTGTLLDFVSLYSEQSNGVFRSQLHNGNATNLAENNWYVTIEFDASRVSQIYGNSNTVQPNTLSCQYLIRY